MTRAVGKRSDSTGERGVRWAGGRTSGPTVRRSFRGFSLIELIVVMTVTLMLTGLMMPALVQIRENAHRIICASNLRQIGLATVLYADDHNNNLPPSQFAEPGGNKQEMMGVHLGFGPENWEGLGWLYFEKYFAAPQILHCPSHHGQHQYERYEELYRRPSDTKQRIYSNYHYAGPTDWAEGTRRRLDQGEQIVLATDGLRTFRDFNHKVGLNVLRGDNSVRWREDTTGQVKNMIPPVPPEDEPPGDGFTDLYAKIWDLLRGAE